MHLVHNWGGGGGGGWWGWGRIKLIFVNMFQYESVQSMLPRAQNQLSELQVANCNLDGIYIYCVLGWT